MIALRKRVSSGVAIPHRVCEAIIEEADEPDTEGTELSSVYNFTNFDLSQQTMARLLKNKRQIVKLWNETKLDQYVSLDVRKDLEALACSA